MRDKEKDFDTELETEYNTQAICQWSHKYVTDWLSDVVKLNLCSHNYEMDKSITGLTLLALNENDIRELIPQSKGFSLSHWKRLWLSVQRLQALHRVGRCPVSDCPIALLAEANAAADGVATISTHTINHYDDRNPRLISGHKLIVDRSQAEIGISAGSTTTGERCRALAGYASIESTASAESYSPPISVDGRVSNIPPEFFKTAISLGYSFLVTWITSFVMVIVHERVPDMKRYPPLPDIFLDNVPHIPWAFHMCELTGTLLFGIWASVCILHKYRMVLLRRFFALAGTVFLLRCVTMLITSLSVPGTHLQCNQNDYTVDDTDMTTTESLELRITRAYTIWSGLGMSIQGVRTCGDYMFSGHTVALTLLNFFITEYTPRNLYFLHTLSWLLNMFGIFFILAAHEHYSIDVFVAFYITSRLFLYYHTLANNQALMSRDSTRTRIWFPMFSYFENSVDGIIPNEYDTIGDLLTGLWLWLMALKDACMLTARRYWVIEESMLKRNGSVKREMRTLPSHQAVVVGGDPSSSTLTTEPIIASNSVSPSPSSANIKEKEN